MRRALALAGRGLGQTNPNPVVGCVIVKAGRVLAEGFHARAGGPHAEVLALRKAGRRARGGTLYVTLEPCVHEAKRTPPCVPAVLASGVRRVVIALRDPNPEVNGRGIRTLRQAGLKVEVGVLEEEARLQNAAFMVAQEQARPYVLLKAAVTLDGRIATARGDSKWITGPKERAEGRRLRRLHDAVLVGIGTARADDPLLMPSPRLARPFLRVVLDSRLRLPRGSRLVRSAAGPSKVLVIGHENRARREALEARGVLVRTDRRKRGPLDLRFVLRTLWAEGVRSLMVEGGAEVLGSFLAERLFDELALFRAPLLLGGRSSLGAFGGKDPRRIAEALRLAPLPTGPGARHERWRPAEPRRSRRRVARAGRRRD
jgi:diaminohydroxyphosphoribosylaminopyrimidine deaminase/5-amino-6-(5-phosphoribosylamino)uracil reductase